MPPAALQSRRPGIPPPEHADLSKIPTGFGKIVMERFPRAPTPPAWLKERESTGGPRQRGHFMQQIQWQDRFNIGVEMIDQAHRRLFSIVQRMTDLYVERHERKFACVEGIKYFKAYALKHFAEEEAYMRKIGYPGYLAHKRIHDRMRFETLPELERLLRASDFSTEAVQRFIGVCTGWLTGHIIIEDRAIVRGEAGPPPANTEEDEEAVIRSVITSPLQELLGCPVRYGGRFSVRDAILHEQCYELTYGTREGERLRVILVLGEALLLRAAGLMFGMDFCERNEIVSFALQETAQNLIQRAAVRFGRHPDDFQLEAGRFLEREAFQERFRERPPEHSLLFHVGQESFALCIDRTAPPPEPGARAPEE